MNKFALYVIPGTLKWVKEELLEKYPEAELTLERPGRIEFEYDSNRVEDFRDLLLPLSTIRTDVENESMRIDNSFREWRQGYIGSGGINPSLAAALCAMAQVSSTDTVCDPFCGSSVIPVTAKLHFNAKRVLASDVSGNAIKESRKNFDAAGLKLKKDYTLSRSDIRQLNIKHDSINKLITNLPFGIRKGNHVTNIDIYRSLADKLSNWLTKDGFALILTVEKKLIEKTFAENYDIQILTEVQQSGLRPTVYKISTSLPKS